MGNMIRKKLGLNKPVDSDDKIICQLRENFKSFSKEDQYRASTVMPQDCSVEFLKNTFGVRDFKSKTAKKLQKKMVCCQLLTQR